MRKFTSAIIQARMNSRRFPRKMIKKLGSDTIIEWVIKRLKKSNKLHSIILATSQRKEDKELIKIAKKNRILFFVGSEQNVLKRYYDTAKKFKVKNIVRVCADNPFVSASEIDLLISTFFKNKKKYSFNHQNLKKFKFANGFGAEIISFKDLEIIVKKAFTKRHKEHVTLYLWDNYKKFDLIPAKSGIQKSKRYICADVDSKEDLIKLNNFVQKFSINVNSNLNDIVDSLHKYNNLKSLINK